jgi:hypothetical protein
METLDLTCAHRLSRHARTVAGHPPGGRSHPRCAGTGLPDPPLPALYFPTPDQSRSPSLPEDWATLFLVDRDAELETILSDGAARPFVGEIPKELSAWLLGVMGPRSPVGHRPHENPPSDRPAEMALRPSLVERKRRAALPTPPRRRHGGSGGISRPCATDIQIGSSASDPCHPPEGSMAHPRWNSSPRKGRTRRNRQHCRRPCVAIGAGLTHTGGGRRRVGPRRVARAG